MTRDERYMHRALALALRGAGRTAPNPMVGCLLVKAGRVIAEGWHQCCGGDHAEVDALKKAGGKACGATAYVTLEPCAHQGRTPPCVEALLAAGIARVVVAMLDPNPRTNGKSVEKLRASGVTVLTGVCENEARQLNVAFIKYITAAMPHVTVKTAQTIDGKAGTRSGQVKWITSPDTRLKAKERRNDFDAIVVGVDTVIADDPQLDAPGRALVKVVVDSTLRMPVEAKLFNGVRPGQVIVAVTRRAALAQRQAFLKRGMGIIVCPAKDGRVDLKALFKALAKIGLVRILIEGGPTLVKAVLAAGLADCVHAYIAPQIMGKAHADAIDGVDLAGVFNGGGFEIRSVERIGPDIFIEADHVHRHH